MCVLHVSSKSKSFAEFLKKSTLPVYQCHEKGDAFLSGKRPPWEDYGFSCDVSKREFEDFAGQIDDANAFLHKYESELRSLISTCPVDDIRLDFPYSCRIHGNIIVQCDYMPPEFLRLAGDLGIGVELSHYPNTEDGEEGTKDDS